MSKYLEKLRRDRQAALEALRGISDTAADEERALTDGEEEQIRSLDAEVEALDDKIKTHQRIADRAEAARAADQAASTAMAAAEGDDDEAARGGVLVQRASAIRVTDPPIYPPGSSEQFSVDLYRSLLSPNMGLRAAASEKLDRHRQQRIDEDEAVRITTASSFGADGGLVPPAYITSMIAEFPRAGKPFWDIIPKTTMPETGEKMFLPQEAETGDVAAFDNEGTNVVASAEGSVTDEEVDIVMVAGRWVTTRRSLDRGVGITDLVWRSLTERYDVKLDAMALNGNSASNETVGILRDTATNNITWTDTTPTFQEFWPMWRKAVGDQWTRRKLPPSLAVWSPKLWTWISSQLDTTNRPLSMGEVDIVRNPVMLGDAVGEYGVMGSSQGLNIMVDANVPTDLGAGSNETAVIVTRPMDLVAAETPTMSITAEQSQVDKLNVEFVLYGYVAFSSGWQGRAATKLTGSGMALT